MIKMYKVGGCVRDAIMGLPSKDIDYAVEAKSFKHMQEHLLSIGVEPYVEKEEFLIVKGKWKGEHADFVLCRQDGFYSDGRRPDNVAIGTIYDDLARRDFTINAIAEHADTKEYLDPHNGIADIKKRTIRCVGSAQRLAEDSLRILRALRFSITKNFVISPETEEGIYEYYPLLKNVSRERIREELNKMFSHSTKDTYQLMTEYKGLFGFIFSHCKVDLTSILKEIKVNKSLNLNS